jgi:hypothetical protein
MNYWLEEIFVTERCSDIQREVEHSRHVRQARPKRDWFEKGKYELGLWFLSIGEHLCQEYDPKDTKTALRGI